MITDEVKKMAVTDLIANLKKCRDLAKAAGFGYEVDDELSRLLEAAEFEYDEL